MADSISLSPFVRNWVTDLTGGIISHQMFGNCPNQELRYMECLEAYGLERGKTKCHKLMEDFYECQTAEKQMKRVMAMRLERQKQIREGKLSKEDYVNPAIHGY